MRIQTFALHAAARLVPCPGSLALACAVLVVPGTGMAQTGPMFLPQSVHDVGSHPTSAAAGDLDGDGALDIVVSNRDSDDVTVLFGLFGNGARDFVGEATYSVGDDPRRCAVGDLDSDGDLDVVTVCAASATVVVLFNTGGGDLAQPVSTSVGSGSEPSDLRLGDIDEDGDLDCCVTRYWLEDVVVLLNDGSGQLSTASTLPLASSPTSLDLGDFDGDGALDVAVACNVAGLGDQVYVALGDGDGGFGEASGHATLANQTAEVIASDLDGDGHLDLAVSCWTLGLSVLFGDGDGSFGTANVLYPPSWEGPLGPVIATDLDGDGSQDLACVLWPVSSGAAAGVSVLLNDSAGSFSVQGTYPVDAGGYTARLCAADLDGDGRPDLIVPGYPTDSVSVLMQDGDCDGNGLFDAPEITPASDLDGDGLLDVCEPPALYAAVLELSLAAGGSQTLALNAPGQGIDLYFVLGSATGTTPGIATEAGILPLNLDGYYVFTLLHPNTLIAGSIGFLDDGGQATAVLSFGPGLSPELAGLVLHHAYVVVDLPGTSAIVFASNAVPLALVP